MPQAIVIGSGLTPNQWQAITRTSADPEEQRIKIKLKKMHFKMFCVLFNEAKELILYNFNNTIQVWCRVQVILIDENMLPVSQLQ